VNPVAAEVKVKPLNKVAPKFPVFELKVKPALLLGPKSPVAAVKNATKQVVSVASSATVIAVGTPPPASAQLRFPLPSVFSN
jgi:hypothetical protein